MPKWLAGVLFVGENGMLVADYGKRLLLPQSQFAGFQPPAPTIPPSVGHHREWIDACKTGSPTTTGSLSSCGPLPPTFRPNKDHSRGPADPTAFPDAVAASRASGG